MPLIVGRETDRRHPCPIPRQQNISSSTCMYPKSDVKGSMEDKTKGLTKRENASLNSETCSSVNESACIFSFRVLAKILHMHSVLSTPQCGVGGGRERWSATQGRKWVLETDHIVLTGIWTLIKR